MNDSMSNYRRQLKSDPNTSVPEAIKELQALPHWIIRTSSKEPFNPRTLKAAKAGQPETWGTYQEAADALARQPPGRYAGMGFQLSKGTGIVAVDLDHCINLETGEIDPWAQEYLLLLDSYAEFSPNDGIHIFLHGELPAKKHKFAITGQRDERAAVEAYQEGRYITMTFRQVPGTSSKIEDRQDKLNELYERLTPQKKTAPARKQQTAAQTPLNLSDEELLEKARNASNGSKFADLWAGSWAGYASQSEADQALCNLLAFWTGKDAARMDRLFRQSGLYREDKWDRAARSGELYGEGTITRAIEACAEVYDPSRNLASINLGSSAGATPAGKAGKAAENLPAVIIGGQLREMRDCALAALAASEKGDPTIFVQSARLVQVARDEANKPIIMQIGVPELKNNLTRSANYYRARTNKNTGEVEYTSITPPKEIAEAILALNPSAWPFSPLEAIVENPVIRPDGTILDTPGYDAATRIFYAPHRAMKDIKVPGTPTPEQAHAALAILLDIIRDFPYTEQADRANALGLIITPFVRPAIKRHVPLALIDAPKQGSGKGLLSDMVSIIATGEPASILTAPESDEEWSKQITAKLMQGSTIITIDNLPGRLQSSKLDAVLTATIWEDRLMGVSKMVKVPQRATWIATGNNIRLGGDLARRCYRIRMDPRVSRPWLKDGFKYPELLEYVSEHRAEIISAILTLIRFWYVAGKPIDESLPKLATFTGWAKIVGSILKHAGIDGFLTNLDALYTEVDEEDNQWSTFLQAWLDTFPNAITIKDLIKRLQDEESADSAENLAGSALSETLPDYLQSKRIEKPASFPIILGKALEKRLETCFGENNLRIEREVDSHTKQKLWRVVAGSAGSATAYARNENEYPSYPVNENSNRDGVRDYPHYPQAAESGQQSNRPEIGTKAPEKPMETPIPVAVPVGVITQTTRNADTLPATYREVEL